MSTIRPRSVLRAILIVFCIALLFAVFDNVLIDDASTRANAEHVASTLRQCQGRIAFEGSERTPFSQTYKFQCNTGTVSVRCMRRAWVMGDRECTAE